MATPPVENDQAPLLRVEGLTVAYGSQVAVSNMNLALDPGDIVAIVGESGSGKSTTALAIPQLLPVEASTPAGRIMFNGHDLITATRSELENIRGNEIGMIYQDPLSALNPVLTIGKQIGETIARHTSLGKKEIRERTIELLDQVGIPEPEHHINDYPHQFSGGMRQRIVIAIAISCSPRLLIADEPTTALDVSIQAQVLGLLRRLCREMGMAMILITHDLHVAAAMAHRVEVMLGGEVVESGLSSRVLSKPTHPYTQRLRAAIPVLDSTERMDFRSYATTASEAVGARANGAAAESEIS